MMSNGTELEAVFAKGNTLVKSKKTGETLFSVPGNISAASALIEMLCDAYWTGYYAGQSSGRANFQQEFKDLLGI